MEKPRMGRGDLLAKGMPKPDPGGRGIFRKFEGHVNPKPHGFGHSGEMRQGVLRTNGKHDGHQIGKHRR